MSPDLDPGLESLVEVALGSRPSTATPVVVGIAGAVAVGKSTLAADLAERVRARGFRVEVVGTDAFLFPNAELDRRGLGPQKGFPETFDLEALTAFVEAVQAGRAPVDVPVYSHEVYDRVTGASRTVGPCDVLVVEGVNALQVPTADRLDLRVYLDAGEELIERWFRERFVALCEAAPPGSFYEPLRAAPREQQLAVAEMAWSGINLVNLREHIEPSRANADAVVEKGADHRIVAVRWRD